MLTFIEQVLQDLKVKNISFSKTVFVLPSKRAGAFLKNSLPNYISETTFAPSILSIEEFVAKLSQLKKINSIETLFLFYEAYRKVNLNEPSESFDSFSKWAQPVIQDFNEIDRYLIDADKLFNYLNAIQEVKHWSVGDNKTELIENYLKLWSNLNLYYNQLSDDLINKGLGYQGLIYREAIEHLEPYIQNTSKKHIFIGFNALNTAEERIIQELLHSDKAIIYWDIDEAHLTNKHHSAAYFINKHKHDWLYYKGNSFYRATTEYSQPKNIQVVGCPKSIGESKYVGHLIKQLSLKNPELSKTAIVLANEDLLNPILNALPVDIGDVNITMGNPLTNTPLFSLFIELFQLHRNKNRKLNYESIVTILTHPVLEGIIASRQNVVNAIYSNNYVFLSLNDIKSLTSNKDKKVMDCLFKWDGSAVNAIEQSLQLINTIKKAVTKEDDKSTLEHLYKFNTIFSMLLDLNETYDYIKDIQTLTPIFKELSSSESLDFFGNPLDGLQIMGMLESRVLDFDTVIITSVNEGVLPAGKTNSSFIPYDVKVENGLPTFKEKDAIYTYHFYRLLYRAKEVYIIYNTETDVLNGGEKSRFIKQLEVEGIHKINHTIATPNVIIETKEQINLPKTDAVIKRLKELALNGFSPSSLTNYIRNPLDFYYEKILGVKEFDLVEETIASNTLGSVIHNTLEDFYKPLVGNVLDVEKLETLKPLITKTIAAHFKKLYLKGDITKGKNLIILEIAKRYISNFINQEIETIKQGNEIKILGIEIENTVDLDIPEITYPIKLTGKVDRIDQFNGTVRIIDYKSGKVEQSNLEIIDWDTLTADYDKFSKAFQVLCYTYMMYRQNKIELPVEAGIISFKNLREISVSR